MRFILVIALAIGSRPKTVTSLVEQNISSAPTGSGSRFYCDGDGVSGNRIEVIYAYASDMPDRYAQYLDSFRDWISEADAIIHDGAAQTGSGRHLRFVTDLDCKLAIQKVQLSSTGDDSLDNTINELSAQGFARSDRKYLIFG